MLLNTSSRPAQIPWDNWSCCALAIFTTRDSVAPSETASFLEYRGQIPTKTPTETKSMSNTGESLTESCIWQAIFSLVEISKIYRKKCTDRYFHRTNQTDQSYWFACKWHYQLIRTRRSDTDPTLQKPSHEEKNQKKRNMKKNHWDQDIYLLSTKFFFLFTPTGGKISGCYHLQPECHKRERNTGTLHRQHIQGNFWGSLWGY